MSRTEDQVRKIISVALGVAAVAALSNGATRDAAGRITRSRMAFVSRTLAGESN